jgi:hypothetical protein
MNKLIVNTVVVAIDSKVEKTFNACGGNTVLLYSKPPKVLSFIFSLKKSLSHDIIIFCVVEMLSCGRLFIDWL